MTVLPTISRGFRLAAAELGMASAARLFIREISQAHGAAGVESLRDQLGREYPVLDCIAAHWLAGTPIPPPNPTQVVHALANIRRVLIVGLEADALDSLLPHLHAVETGFVTEGRALLPDWRRVLANYDTVEAVSLGDFQQWAGREAALLTFVYGGDDHIVHVSPQWLRVQGPDVRASFRSIVGWDQLGLALEVYPRWFAEVERASFSEIVEP